MYTVLRQKEAYRVGWRRRRKNFASRDCGVPPLMG